MWAPRSTVAWRTVRSSRQFYTSLHRTGTQQQAAWHHKPFRHMPSAARALAVAPASASAAACTRCSSSSSNTTPGANAAPFVRPRVGVVVTVLDTRCRKGSRSGNGGGDSDAKADSCSEPRVLLIRRGRAPSKGMWSLPGGKVELGETLTSAAILLPEHPIFTATDAILPRIDDSKLHEAASHQAATGESVAADKVHYHYVLVHLLGYRASPTAQAVASDDAAGADWVSIGALPGMVERKELVPKTPFVVKQALRYHQELAASGRLP